MLGHELQNLCWLFRHRDSQRGITATGKGGRVKGTMNFVSGLLTFQTFNFFTKKQEFKKFEAN